MKQDELAKEFKRLRNLTYYGVLSILAGIGLVIHQNEGNEWIATFSGILVIISLGILYYYYIKS